MTALQRIASSRKVFEISFSSAKVRLFPSVHRSEVKIWGDLQEWNTDR